MQIFYLTVIVGQVFAWVLVSRSYLAETKALVKVTSSSEAQDIFQVYTGCRQNSLWTKLVEVMEFQLSYFKSKRWCCESAALNTPANLENSAVSTGLEKVGFHSNPKERQGQRRLKLLHNCTHLTR